MFKWGMAKIMGVDVDSRKISHIFHFFLFDAWGNQI